MLDRREFIFQSATAATAFSFRNQLLAQVYSSDARMPDDSLFRASEEAYWRQIRKQFLIPPDEVYLNNGTVGSCPRPVLKAVFDAYQETEKLAQADPEDYPIWGYGPWNEFRDPLAGFVGASRDELALLRNATEANSFMANGIDMKAGEEVLISDQEHPSGESPWNLKGKRYGIVVRKFEIPRPLLSAADLLNRINDAISPRTRVLFVSHITTMTGVVLPVKDICALARSKGLISMIDGAQVIGQMRLNVKELGCDMYGSSPHKWLMAPKGTGFLYVREEMIDRLWSTVTTEGWDNPKLRAARFQQIGSSNVPALWGLRSAIDFANQIGMERIERRGRQLSDYLHSEMVKRGAESWTSPDPSLHCAMAAVLVPPFKIAELEHALWSRHRIRIRGGGGSDFKIRLSTPYYLQREEIDHFLEKFDEYRKGSKQQAASSKALNL